MTVEQMIQARIHAAEVAEKLAAAYWADTHRQFLLEAAREAFIRLADAMGYEGYDAEARP